MNQKISRKGIRKGTAPLPNLKDMQRAFWLNHELKSKSYFGFAEAAATEAVDSEDERLEQEARGTPQEEKIVPDKRMLLEKRWTQEKELDFELFVEMIH